MKKIIIIFFFILLVNTKIFATSDYVAVNNITKQLCVFEAEDIYTPLCWKNIYESGDITYINKGYTYTNNPYLIEETILIFIIFLIILFILIYRKIKYKKGLILLYRLSVKHIFKIKRIIFFFILWFLIHSIIIIIDGLIDEKYYVGELCIILGNKVELSGQPSNRLKSRLDKAIEVYYRQKRIKYILVSGGIGKEGFDEATIMKQYLISKGIHKEKIFEDNQGINTYKTAYNAKLLMKKLNISSAIVISQYLHITRLKLAFSKMGLRHVDSIHCNYFEIRDVYSLVREFFGYYYYLIK
mgnify:CR=1 FL=1